MGINQFEPNLNAVHIDRNGNIYFGDQQHILVYTPLKEHLRIHPVTIVNSISVALQPIDPVHQKTFSHDRNSFLFDYVGIWLTDPQVVDYRYRLRGFDQGWIRSRGSPGDLLQPAAGRFYL